MTSRTFKEGIFGALFVVGMPFFLFWLFNKIFPVFGVKGSH